MGRTSTTWKKGQSGNLKGCPRKGERIADYLAKMAGLGDDDGEGASHRDRKRELAEVLWRIALAGDIPAIRLLINRLDGPESLMLRGPDDDDGMLAPVFTVINKLTFEQWNQLYVDESSKQLNP
jgi:hypothetical protein